MRTVNGGGVLTNQQHDQALTALVKTIQFPSLNSTVVVVPIGTPGTLTLVSPPPQLGHYNKGDVLNYRDGNNNNNATFHVDSNVGPSTYAVTRTA